MRRILLLTAGALVWMALLLTGSLSAHAQQTNADSLFYQARHAAFDQKDLSRAIHLMHQALKTSPQDADYQIFLGRLYSWNHQPDSSRLILRKVLRSHPRYVDAYRALADLQFWNHQPAAALKTVNAGLALSAQDEHLLLRKAQVLREMGESQRSKALMDTLHLLYPEGAEAAGSDTSSHREAPLNRVGITYDWVHFSQQFRHDWQLVSVSYERDAKIGTLIGRLNYANRFSAGGFLPEMDFYPHISKTFYGYLNAGFSDTLGVFPRLRAGASLYGKLPRDFELDAGVRFLKYTHPLLIYTASLGKYVKNFWFNFRTYLNPGRQQASQTYILTGRYYYGGKDDYAYLMGSSGISPDDASSNALLKLNQELKSRGVGAGFYKTLGKTNVINASLSWAWQQYTASSSGYQIDGGIGYFRIF